MCLKESVIIKWQLTLQVGEVRIIAFRPAGHTEVDYLDKVQVIFFVPIVFRPAGTIAEQSTKS